MRRDDKYRPPSTAHRPIHHSTTKPSTTNPFIRPVTRSASASSLAAVTARHSSTDQIYRMPLRSKPPATRPSAPCTRCGRLSHHLNAQGICRRHRSGPPKEYHCIHHHYHIYPPTSDPGPYLQAVVDQLRTAAAQPSPMDIVELPSTPSTPSMRSGPSTSAGERRSERPGMPACLVAGRHPPPVQRDTKPTWTPAWTHEASRSG